MKIAIDCRMSGKSGIGRYLDGILPGMIETAGSENQFFLFGKRERLKIYQDKDGVEIEECGIKPFSFKDLYFFSHSIAKKINACDIFYSPYCNIPSGIHIPICTTIHDLVFLDMPIASLVGTHIRNMIYHYSVMRSAKIFTVSEFSASRIRTLLRCKKPIVVGYNALAKNLADFKKEQEKNSSLNQIILFVGNIKKHKGLQTLLPAFVLARRRGLNARLVIVGESKNFRSADKQFSDRLFDAQKTGDVQFTGCVSDEELYSLYQKARLLVQPSLYEGFGIPPLEALSFGTHVLISDIPVFREIYDGYPVSYFHAGDKEDLAAKLVPAFNSAKEPLPPLPQKYDFAATSALILKELSETILQKQTQ